MIRSLPLALALAIATPSSAFEIVVNIQHAVCGNTTGSMWAYAVGGAIPYTYLWSNGSTSSTQSNIPPGVYTLTVTDALGTEASVEVELVQTDALFPPFAPPQAWSCDADCNAGFYYYIPLPGNGFPYTVVFDPPGPTGGASPNGLYFNGLCPGETYMVTVSNANGCTGVVGPIEVLGEMAPELLASEVTGSCPGGATGSMLLTFDQADSIIVGGPNGFVWAPSVNPFFLSNLAPGAYTIDVYAYQSVNNPPGSASTNCHSVFQITIPVSNEPCGSISGTLYADLDTDCDQGLADPGMPWRVLTIQPGDHHVLSNGSGAFYTELFYGGYALNTTQAGYALVCPGLPAPFTLDAGSPAATIDIAQEPLFGPDARAFLSMGIHRPGFEVDYHVSATNEGPFNFPGASLNLFFDPLLTIVDNGGGSLVGSGHLRWVLGDLAPYSSAAFTVTLAVPPNAALIGTPVTGTATLDLAAPDSDPDNDSYTATTTIIGAYDPNDKLVQTSSALSPLQYFLDQDLWVDYTIRFQNTGTAEAINVHLLDTIAPEFDLTSLQLLGTSHAFTASLHPGRVLRFDFPDIMLPDSTSDFAGSQGFASFRLRPVGGLPLGTILSNAADIYFDFNEPIRTNDADLVIDISTGVAERTTSFLHLHPNPADDLLQIVMPDGHWTIEVIGVDGRVAQRFRMSGDRMAMDVSGLSPGTYLLRLTEAKGTGVVGRFVKR